MSIIQKPVSIHAVASALGVSSHDLGKLCTSDQINKWAKYKPVRSAFLGETGKTSGNNWWQGLDGMCGLDIKNTTSPSGILSLNPDWAYLKPRGIRPPIVEPQRLLDFDGYKTDGRTTPPTGYLSEDGQQTIFFPPERYPYFNLVIYAQQLDAYSLNQGDIVVDGSPLSEWYIGLAGYVEGESIPFLRSGATGDIKLKDAYGRSYEYSVDPSGYSVVWSGKVWTLCPYLYKPTRDGETLYISMGNPWSAIVVKVATNVIVTRDATASLSGSLLYYGFTIQNGYAEAKTLPTRLIFYWALEPRELFEDDKSEIYNLPDRTIDAVDSKSFSDSVTITSHLDWDALGAKLQYYYNGAWHYIYDNYGQSEIWLRGTPPTV